MEFVENKPEVMDLKGSYDLLGKSNMTLNKSSVATVDCLGYDIFPKTHLPDVLTFGKTIINTINPHCYIVARKDNIYRQALKKSTILLPDGIGITWAVNVLKRQKITRFSGSELHVQLLQKMNEKRGKVFYLGSSDSTLQKIHKRIKKEYPNIRVASYSPPYKSMFTNEENNQILASINKFQPDVLFVGMTAPKQEKWAYQFQDQLNVKVIASVGAVFDFYAGRIKRPGKFWISLGLEWLPRLLREPKRLWRRNFISTPGFIWIVICEKCKMLVKKS